MDETNTRTFWLCQTDDDTYLAASTGSPRFCFAGATENEVIGKATRALDAYFGGEFTPIAKKQSESKPLQELRPIRVQAYIPKEYAAA